LKKSILVLLEGSEIIGHFDKRGGSLIDFEK